MTDPSENIPSETDIGDPAPPVDVKQIGKVVMLVGSFPPMYCGVGDSAYELARELHRKGVEIEAVTDSDADSRSPESGSFPIHAVVDGWGLRGMKRLIRTIESLEPDILHIHYPSKAYGHGLGVPFLPMVLRSRRRKFKIVLTLHEFRLSHSLRKLASFVLLDACDAIAMPCTLELEALVRRHMSVAEKINAAIPVGPVGPSPDALTDDERRRLRREMRSKWGVGDDAVVLLHYGTPTPSKGLEVFFKALKILKLEGLTPLLVVAGDHRPDEDDFHRLLAGQPGGLGVKDQVMWLGRRPTDELAGVFSAADIGVFPFIDGFSFRRSSLVGVLMWDLPIITTEPDGDLEGIGGQEKVRFVERNDPKALATAIITLAANPKALDAARRAPNPLKEYFRWDRIADQYIDLYQEVRQKNESGDRA